MAQINTGSFPDSGTGDNLREAFIKTIENFESWEANFPPSYLFPYTGSARMDGNLIITGSILYSFDPTSPFSSPSDIDIFTTNIKGNAITGSGEFSNAGNTQFSNFFLSKYNGNTPDVSSTPISFALWNASNSAIGNFPSLQFISNSFSSERPQIYLNANNAVYSNLNTSIRIGRNASQQFSAYLPYAYGDNGSGYTSWKMKGPDQPFLFSATYNDNTDERHIAIKQAIDFNKRETIQIKGTFYMEECKVLAGGLPTEDPQYPGSLYRVDSEDLGFDPGEVIIVVSQG